MALIDSPSVFEILTYIIGEPVNDVEHTILYFVACFIGVFLYFTVIFMIMFVKDSLTKWG